MLKIGYLNYLFNDLIEIKEDLRESNYSNYGEFEIVELENSHPDIIYENIKNEEQFLYTSVWDDNRSIFFKPLGMLEPLLEDDTLKMVYIKNENNEIIEIYKKDFVRIMFNHEYNLSLINLVKEY